MKFSEIIDLNLLIKLTTISLILKDVILKSFRIDSRQTFFIYAAYNMHNNLSKNLFKSVTLRVVSELRLHFYATIGGNGPFWLAHFESGPLWAIKMDRIPSSRNQFQILKLMVLYLWKCSFNHLSQLTPNSLPITPRGDLISYRD